VISIRQILQNWRDLWLGILKILDRPDRFLRPGQAGYKPIGSIGLLTPLVVLGLLAAQCQNSPTPFLPATPTAPALRIALLIPTSGELATQGRIIGNGITLAFDEWNRRGGVLGHRFEWAVYDTGCSFEAGTQAARQAIEAGHQFLIGPICSEAAIAAARLAETANVLMITPTATHPLVTVSPQGQTRPTVFRISYSYEWQGQAAARFARDSLNVSRVALLIKLGDDYTTNLADTFAREFANEGGQIVYQATYQHEAEDFTDILKAIDQSGAELLYLPGSSTIANSIARRLGELGLVKAASSSVSLRLLGSDGWEAEALDLATAAGAHFPVHYTFTVGQPLAQSWAETYKSINSVKPDTLAALSYDAANLLAEAIDRARTIEPMAITCVLEQDNFEGVTGQMAFDRFHNPIKPILFMQIQAERLVYAGTIISSN
jgi:branched-chain amino acid transport system substrate-binding protein